ncbi:unnamed protein product [Microthlaspi erraticum]|uniref:Uncharacterized protein n=1 Tax=Microthlaspi erraticum TaxID=1685480 RepID=A0A6D2L561_9BRAS|nr:unnamed protein product [Microthlaspi erraticum]
MAALARISSEMKKRGHKLPQSHQGMEIRSRKMITIIFLNVKEEPSTKKAKLNGEYDNGSSSISLLNDEVSNSLNKIQADYIGSETPSPNHTPQNRGAVGPVPPPVP